MLISYKRGQGSIICRVKILDSAATTGAGKTGLAYNTANLLIGTIADNEASSTVYSNAGSTTETITTLGTFAAPTATKCRFKEVDATNHKGVYELQLADARYAVSSAKSLLVSISGPTGAAETDFIIPLTDHDPYDVVRGGMTALPNVVSGSAGAIVTSGTGTAQILLSSGKVVTPDDQKVDLNTIKTQAVVCAAGATVGPYVGNATAALAVDGSGHVTIGAMGASTLTASALAADAVTEIQSGLSTLTQTQVTGGAYALNHASFAFNAALDFTTTQKAATLARVTLVDTTTTNTDMRGTDNAATAANLATVAGYLDTEIAAILADTNELQTDWANGGRLDLILDARSSQTSVDDLPTNAELATALGTADDATLAAIAALNNLSAAQVNAEVDTALADYDAPTNAEMVARTLAAASYATAANQATILSGITGMQGATFDTATDSLEAIRNRGDAAWLTATGFSTHSAADVVTAIGTGSTLTALATAANLATANAALAKLDDTVEDNAGTYRFTTAALANGPSGGSAPTAVQIRQEMDSNSTQLAAIVADTNELQTDWVNGGRLDLILDATATQASVNTIDDLLDTEVPAIKTVTDHLDTAMQLDGSVYRFTANALELAPSGSTTVTVTPYTATVSGGIVSDSGKLTAYQHRRFGPFVITVVDEDGDPVNLSAATLVFVATDPDGDGTTALFTVTQASGDITVGGASNNVITIEQDDTNTGTALDFIWTITNTVTDAVVARGNRPVSRIEMTADVA